MSIAVNPILPVIAAQSAAPDLVLQPGAVVDAQVLKLLSDNLVRIAISNLSIDVLSEVPLQAGQALQLAVSQTESGIRLAVVGPNSSATAGSLPDTVTLAPNALADIASKAPAATAPAANALTPPERLAVSAVVQTAATQQGSLAPLFANLGVAATGALPPKLQQAVIQVLAQQTSLDQNLSGNDVKSAFQKSGLFLEASLATGTVSPAAGIPDLKAALIVLRQTLVASLGTAGPTAQSPTATATAATPSPSVAATSAGSKAQTPTALTADAASPLRPAATSPKAPSLSPDVSVQEVLLPPEREPLADAFRPSADAGRIVLTAALPDAEPRLATVAAALNLLQEAVQRSPREGVGTSLVPATPRALRNDEVTVHTNTPPPPFRGALPSPQPIASPSIAPNAPLATTARHLLGDTDAAIARQTLLQVASLPDRVDASGARLDPVTPEWNFEIPFATPQGTAMAQFEIARDGGGGEVEAAKRVWRARFSIDVEPAGPVHAMISLSGDKTSVRMWAERPATAAQLRDGAAQLGLALAKAELQPGDIVIRVGAPPVATPARAGHFLDRAL